MLEHELVDRSSRDLRGRGHERKARQVVHARQGHVEQVWVGVFGDLGGGVLVAATLQSLLADGIARVLGMTGDRYTLELRCYGYNAVLGDLDPATRGRRRSDRHRARSGPAGSSGAIVPADSRPRIVLGCCSL